MSASITTRAPIAISTTMSTAILITVSISTTPINDVHFDNDVDFDTDVDFESDTIWFR